MTTLVQLKAALPKSKYRLDKHVAYVPTDEDAKGFENFLGSVILSKVGMGFIEALEARAATLGGKLIRLSPPGVTPFNKKAKGWQITDDDGRVVHSIPPSWYVTLAKAMFDVGPSCQNRTIKAWIYNLLPDYKTALKSQGK